MTPKKDLAAAVKSLMAVNTRLEAENAALAKRVEELEPLVKVMAFCHDPNRPDFDSVFINNKHCKAAKSALEDK